MPLDIGSAYGKISIDYSSVQKAVKEIQASLGRLSGGDSAFAKVGKSAEAGLGKVNKSADTAGASLKKLSGTLDKINPAVMLGIGAAAAAAAGLVVKSAFDMNATLETTQLQFETLMGSADDAREHVAFLFEFAKKTPFETGPIIEASRMLQTFGGAALNTEGNLTLIGDAAAAVNAPINELGFWVGRLYSNLRGGQPFGEAAMRLQELAVLSPQARQQMEALQKSGAGADEVFAVFQDNLGLFTGAMEKQAGTWSGMISTLKDSLKIAAAEGMKPFFETAKEGLASTIEALNSPEFVSGVQEFAAGLGNALKVIVPLAVEHGPALLKVLTGVGVALGTLSISLKVATGITALKTAFAGLTGASAAAGVASSGALAGTMAALTPLLPVIALVAGAVALLAVAWAKDWGGIRQKTAEAVESVRRVIDKGMAAWRGFWEKHGAGIIQFTGHLWEAIKSHFKAGMTVVSNVLQAASALLRGDWEELGRHLSEAAHAWIEGWKETFSHLGEAIGPALQAAGRRIREWWDDIDWESFGRSALDGLQRGLSGQGAHAAGQRAREEFQAGWEQGGQEPTTDAWVERAAAEAAAAIEDATRSAASADRVLNNYATNYEHIAEKAEDAGRGVSRTAAHFIMSGEGAKLAADRTDKFAGSLGQLGDKARAALDGLTAAKLEAESFTAAYQAIEDDYTNELPGADKPLVAPEQNVTITTGGLSAEDTALLEQYRDAAARLQDEIFELTNGIGTFGVEQEKINEKLAGAQGELEHYKTLMAPLEGVVGEVSTAHQGLSVNVDAVRQGIYDQLAQMPDAGAAAVAFAAATGIMSEAQAEAALKAVLVKQEIDRLAVKIAEGLPIETALADLDSFIQKIESGVTPATETMAADVPARVTEMKDAMSEGALAAGEAVPAGITEGINTRLEEATSAAEGAATDVVDAVRNVFGVESPSTVFAEIGGELMAGLKEGVEDGSAAVVRLIEDTAAEVLEAWDYAIDRAPYIGRAIIEGIIEGVEAYRGMLVAKMKEIARQAYEEAMNEIYAHSPSRLFMNTGKAMIDGIIAGLDAGRNALNDAVRERAGETYRVAMDAVEATSTTPAFMSVGQAIIGGITAGIESERQDLLDQLADVAEEIRHARGDMLEQLLADQADLQQQLAELNATGLAEAFMGAAGSLLGGAMGVFEQQAEALAGQIEAAQGTLEGAIGNLSPFADDPTINNLLDMTADQQAYYLRTMQGQYEFTSNQEAMRRLQEAIRLADERNLLEQEYIRQQEELAALEEARRQLDFLGYQVDLIKLITENGLDASILEGLELGLDANMTDIIAAMTAAVQQLITAAEEELDIASPSGVFRTIGSRIMEGLERGIAAADPTTALQEQLDGLTRVFDPARSPVDALAENLFGMAAGIRDGAGDMVDAMLASADELNEAALLPGAALQQQIDGLGRLFDPAASPFAALQGHLGQLLPGAALQQQLPMLRANATIFDGQYLADVLRDYLGAPQPAGATATTTAPKQTVYIFGGYNPQVGRQPAIDPIRDLYYQGL